MRLDDGGEASTITDLLARFAGRPWLYELTDLPEAEKARAGVRYYPHGLITRDPIETGDGPYVVVVDGDLVTTGHVGFDTDDYVPARVIVTGDVRAGSLSFDNGARIVIEGAAHVERACFGQHGDRDGVLSVGGELAVPFLALDWNSSVHAGKGVRALIYASTSFWEDLEPDIVDRREGEDARYFRADVLDRYGDLDLDRAIAAARAGTEFLLPGVA